MNRDEGSYTLSHSYDRFLATWQEKEKEMNNFF